MKRLFLDLNVFNNNTVIDFNLNYKISSFIYSIIKDDYPEIHNKNDGKKFTFSNLILEDFRIIKGSGILLKSKKAGLIISTSDEKFVDIFMNNIDYNKIYKIDNVVFKIKSIKFDSEKISSNVVGLRTISPICIAKNHINDNGKKIKKFLSPSDNDYNEYFIKNFLGANNIDVFLEIDKSSIKKKKIELFDNKQTVNAYIFDFFIKCDDIDLLNKNYFDGFGSKNSQGFGLVQLIRQ